MKNINITNGECLNEYLKNKNHLVKYPTTQPQFIPLPNSQQVKLRTFANKTNLHFECEIEPTLKASVPKSIGASVSSNITQIDILSKELGTKKTGHTGTLDPNATGVLPLLIGKATGISKYLINHDKTYIATLKLGIKPNEINYEENR